MTPKFVIQISKTGKLLSIKTTAPISTLLINVCDIVIEEKDASLWTVWDERNTDEALRAQPGLIGSTKPFPWTVPCEIPLDHPDDESE